MLRLGAIFAFPECPEVSPAVKEGKDAGCLFLNAGRVLVWNHTPLVSSTSTLMTAL
jgi:hypothetical protein